MKCYICKENVDTSTTVAVRVVKKELLEIEICDYCRQMILAELTKQFIIEKWLPNMED